MAGIGLIDFIVKIIESRKQAQYLESTKQWPSAVSEVIDWNVVAGEPKSEDENKYQLEGTLGLSVNDGRFYGLVRSVGMVHGEAQRMVRSGTLPTSVTVRYNPADPGDMIAAPKPAELPFEVRVP